MGPLGLQKKTLHLRMSPFGEFRREAAAGKMFSVDEHDHTFAMLSAFRCLVRVL